MSTVADFMTFVKSSNVSIGFCGITAEADAAYHRLLREIGDAILEEHGIERQDPPKMPPSTAVLGQAAERKFAEMKALFEKS
jgi:hypothetical protein